MAWPWRFVDLDHDAKTLRRDTLDRYAAYSQLSALLPVLAVLGARAGLYLYRAVAPSAAYSSVPDSPSLKTRRQSPWGALVARLRALQWWLGGEVYFLGAHRGERDLWVFGALWAVWMLVLSVSATGEDYLHVTKRFGAVAAAQFPIQYLLALKYLNPFAIALRVSHEQVNRWHRVQGRVVYLLLLLHALFYLNFFIQSGILGRRLFAPVVFAGVVSWIGINLLTATAIDVVRNLSYRLFFITHLLVAFALPPLLFYHAAPARLSMVAALVFIVVDIVVRRLNTQTVQAAIDKIPGTNLVRVSMALSDRKRLDAFREHPGSHIYMSVPPAARPDPNPASKSSIVFEFLFNPFTVASVNESTGDVTLLARERNGPMTTALARLGTGPSSRQPSNPNETRVPLSIEGPYGAAQYFPNLAGSDYDRVLLVTGGVGATFCVPLYLALRDEKPASKVQLVWAVRSPGDASWAVENTAAAGGDGGARRSILLDENVQLYITGEFDEATAGGEAAGAEVEMDALDHHERVHHGERPDLRKIVDETFKLGSEERVAVLVCGPEGMCRELREHVSSWVVRGRSVWWHNETFGW